MAQRHVTVYPTDSPSYRLIRGAIKGWLVDHHTPAMWTPRLRGFQVRTERIADIVAMLEADGFQVHMYDREARP